MNVAQMCAARADSSPHKTAIVYRDVSFDFEALSALVERCASGLAGLGLSRNVRTTGIARIALLLEKTPELVVSFIACARLGAMVVPLNYQLKPAMLRDVIEGYDIDALIVAGKFLRLLSEVPKGHKALKNLVVCGPYDAGTGGALLVWDKLIDKAPDGHIGAAHEPPSPTDDDEPFYLNFTSGSTGEPKAAITTHTNLFYNTVSSIETLGLRHDDVHLCMFPAYLHPHEIFIRGLYLGGTSVLENSLFPKSVARAISEHGVTCMMGAATLYERLLPFAGNSEFNYSTLRIAESGGMVTRETQNRAFEAGFGIPITPVWGSTETTGVAVAPHAGQDRAAIGGVRRGGSVGKAALSYEIRVVREDGSDAACMELGEMFVAGKGVTSGYFQPAGEAPDEANDAYSDGWFKTGDLVKRDEDGFIYFVDRKDSMMKVAGLKVFPAAIERVLREHPAVEDVCIIPVEDSLRGQAPKAIVVKRPGASVDALDLKAFCASKLTTYEVPRSFEFRESIPRSPSGKLLRAAVLELCKVDSIHADVADFRAQIDRIDVMLVKLLNERARSLLSIREQAEDKAEKRFSPMREEEVLRNVLGHNSGPAHDGTIEEIFRGILSAFKKM
ncbi:MAG: AMP-binding protein [Candidatus Coatesbacteria bacterium]|nr:AMP-binding protein [Candidatus Coatesbacteria bacterium]